MKRGNCRVTPRKKGARQVCFQNLAHVNPQEMMNVNQGFVLLEETQEGSEADFFGLFRSI